VNFDINNLVNQILRIIEETSERFIYHSEKLLRNHIITCAYALKERLSGLNSKIKIIEREPRIYNKPVGILLLIDSEPRTYICIDFIYKFRRGIIRNIVKKFEDICREAEYNNERIVLVLVLVSKKSRKRLKPQSYSLIMSLKDKYRSIVDIRIRGIKLSRKLSFDLPCTIKPNERDKALILIKEIIKLARKEVILVDPYIDRESIEFICTNLNPEVSLIIINGHGKNENPLTKHKKLIKACRKYSKKYGHRIMLFSTSLVHDRWIVIDRFQVFVLGTSLKDLGRRKISVITLLEGKGGLDIIAKIVNEIIPQSKRLF